MADRCTLFLSSDMPPPFCIYHPRLCTACCKMRLSRTYISRLELGVPSHSPTLDLDDLKASPSLQGSAKSYVVVKQPGQEYMVARVLESPHTLPPSSPVIVHAISAHAGVCVTRHTYMPVNALHGISAQPQCDSTSFRQQTQGVRQVNPQDQADASLSGLSRISSAGSLQPTQDPLDQVDSMTDSCELLDTGPPRMVAVSLHPCNPDHLHANRQHGRLLTLSHAAEADSRSTDLANEQVAGDMKDLGLDRRSSRHSLSTVEACAAFLADTTGLLTLQASAPTEGSTRQTDVDSSLGEHKDAYQHCQDPKSCSQSACLAPVDGLGATEQPNPGNQIQTHAACCAETDGKAPSHVTSSSNEAWHARLV